MVRVPIGGVTLALLAFATTTVATGAVAEAQERRWQGRNAGPPKTTAALARTASRAEPAAPKVAAPIEPLLGIVSLHRQTVTFYAGTEPIAEAPVSSGQSGYRTPTGVFSIIQKARYHESNIYSGAPMPFMQRLTWSGIALHAGALPGYPASHGCIRLPNAFAERLFGMTRVGARVIVAPETVTPVAIVHERLPVPKLTEVTEPATEKPAAAPTSLSVGAAFVSTATAAPASTTLLSPKKAAEFEKRRAAKAVGDMQRAAKESLQMATAASATAEQAKSGISAAEETVAELLRRLSRAQGMVATAVSDEDRVQAEASVAVAEEDLTEARHLVAAARQGEQQAADHALSIAVAARKAEDDASDAEEQARVAMRGTEPLTVYVSRKENRAYLRQGLTPLMEGDVTINNLLAPIGTHVFTAVDADETGTKIGWTAVTVPEAGQPAISATAALGRVTFAPKLSDEISRRVWPGATIIISDYGVSGETGKGTDFIVLTK